LSDGEQNLYTRAGAFGVDADSNLIDPATGYYVQRIGSEGEIDSFQVSGNSNIHVPYDVTLPANATSTIRVQGNLSSDASFSAARTQVLTSNIAFTTGNGTPAVATDEIDQLDQYTGTLSSGVITFSGYKPDGTALGSSPTTDLTMDVTATTTLQDVLNHLNKTNEQQTITITGSPTGGTFTLDFGSGSPATVAYNATATQVQTALESLSTISAGHWWRPSRHPRCC